MIKFCFTRTLTLTNLRLCSNNNKASAAHHCHPADGRNALADGRQVVEEAAAAVSFPERLDLLDVIRNGLEQVTELRLHEKEEEEEDKEKEEEEEEVEKEKDKEEGGAREGDEEEGRRRILGLGSDLKEIKGCRGLFGLYISQFPLYNKKNPHRLSIFFF